MRDHHFLPTFVFLLIACGLSATTAAIPTLHHVAPSTRQAPATLSFEFFVNTLADSTDEDGMARLRYAFAPLIGKTWRAEGNWWSGVKFTKEIHFKWDLEQQIVVASSDGLIKPGTQDWGQRNYGIRYWSRPDSVLRFSEYDVAGQRTDGLLTIEEGDIYYHYDYNGIKMTDHWEKVDEATYNFKIGIMGDDGIWTKEFLRTQFIDLNTTAKALMSSDPSLPYRQIPDAPEKYNAATVAARMIDGLGFRYYWATEGLRQPDLDYRTTSDARSSAETLEHIHGLARVVRNAVFEEPNNSGGPAEELSFAERRTETLRLLQQASTRLKNAKGKELRRFNMIFQRGENQSAFPFWNVINGPLADATWHVGQIVAFRRASGNPFNNKVSVLRGTVRE